MELGATVCLPQSPLCGSCPVRTHCGAYQQVCWRRVCVCARACVCVFKVCLLGSTSVFSGFGREREVVSSSLHRESPTVCPATHGSCLLLRLSIVSPRPPAMETQVVCACVCVCMCQGLCPYSLGVTNYPRKDKQKKMREEHVIYYYMYIFAFSSSILLFQFAVGVVEWNVDRHLRRYLIQRRPETGGPDPFHTLSPFQINLQAF